ncbi:MAG: CBS domain-containing protein [Saprospiraceae bacterium]|jgi:CBS domain-containing protein|tara:strand:+ start:584 stop:1006 length:423 start_codon:yes stop_codon:yes gene_type:complete
MFRVEDIMSKNVLVAKKDTPLNEIINAFLKSKIHHMPIVNSKGGLRAIISANDVFEAIHEMDQFAANYNCYSLESRIETKDEMTSSVISITKEQSILEAVDLMVKNNIHALPVEEDEKVVGIITSNDILKAIYEGQLLLI